MKRFLLLLLSPLIFVACTKENSEGDEGGGGSNQLYINTATGSTWNYEVTESEAGDEPYSYEYTLTSTNRDTTIGGKKYHVYEDSFDEESYMFTNGKQYFQIGFEEDMSVEVLFLKTDVAENATWTQNINSDFEGIPIPAKIVHKLTGKNITHTVKGKEYKNVMRVLSTIDVSYGGIAEVHLSTENYYAPGIGQIQSDLELEGNLAGETIDASSQTLLVSSQMK